MSECHIFPTLAAILWVGDGGVTAVAATVVLCSAEGAAAAFPAGSNSAKLACFFHPTSDYGPGLQIAFWFSGC